jgi:hypothetical protein
MRISRDTFIARCRAALGDMPQAEPRPLFAWLAKLEGLLARPQVERREPAPGWPAAEVIDISPAGTTSRRVTCAPRDDADAARTNGWEPGTVIVGDEGYGLDAIRIDYLGRTKVFATHLARHRGGAWQRGTGNESIWTLSCRWWRRATDEELAAIEAATSRSRTA